MLVICEKCNTEMEPDGIEYTTKEGNTKMNYICKHAHVQAIKVDRPGNIEIIIRDIIKERDRQKTLVFDGKSSEEFDKDNSQGDWIGFITRYASGAHPRLENRRDEHSFRTAMIKVAALAVAAIENYDKGYYQ